MAIYPTGSYRKITSDSNDVTNPKTCNYAIFFIDLSIRITGNRNTNITITEACAWFIKTGIMLSSCWRKKRMYAMIDMHWLRKMREAVKRWPPGPIAAKARSE